MKNLSNQEASNHLKALYDAAPYPAVLTDNMSSRTPLLLHWINAAVAPDGLALHPESHILIAGCGSGEEAILLAQQFPQAQVVGVDFSERSIAQANLHAETANLTNISFEVADLTSAEWCKKYAPFDFISCHGVADFVLDTNALMQTLAYCLAPNGVVCMTVNSPDHPAGRLREAFATLGTSAASFRDTPEQRAQLRLMVQLMGSNIGIHGLADAPKAYLDVDIFAPIAHHYNIDTWCQRAEEAGLWFCGSMDASVGLTELSDEQLPLLFGLGKADLSAWMVRLRKPPGMQLLFSPRKPIEPRFDMPKEILAWSPRLAACVGELPPLTGESNRPRPMTLRFPSLPDFVIYCTAYDLEVLRCCDGSRSIGAIRADLAVEGDSDSLLACLYRAYQFGVLTD